MAEYGPLKCCLLCGRDTRSKTGVCAICMGHGKVTRHTEERDRSRLDPMLDDFAEDDYGEESGPDSIYHERE